MDFVYENSLMDDDQSKGIGCVGDGFINFSEKNDLLDRVYVTENFLEEDFQEKEKETTKKDKYLVRKIVVRSLMAIQLIIASILNAKLTTMDVLPLKYDILLVVAIVLFNIGMWFSTKTKKLTIVMSTLSVILSTVLVVGTSTVFKVKDTVDSIITSSDYEVVKISAVVPVQSTITNIKDIGGRTMGYLTYNEHIENLKKEVEKKASFPPQYTEYEAETLLADALYQGKEEVALVETTTLDTLRQTEGYMDIDQKVRVLHTFEVKIQKKLDKDNKAAMAKDTFVVYISGSDSREGLKEVTLSDTNLLAVVNTKKRKIQLISTPRDFYVPIADINREDKLTHAGNGGVGRSMRTLEMLYGVEVDYYFKICFEGFTRLIDELGGIDVYSPKNFTTYYTRIDYYEGYQHVNGENALHFARERRAFIDGDFQRGKNQMEVIKGIGKQMTTKEALTNFDGVMGSMSGCFETDIPSETMYQIVKNQLDKNIPWEISTKGVTGYDDKVNDRDWIIRPQQKSVEEAKVLINECISNQR